MAAVVSLRRATTTLRGPSASAVEAFVVSPPAGGGLTTTVRASMAAAGRLHAATWRLKVARGPLSAAIRCLRAASASSFACARGLMVEYER